MRHRTRRSARAGATIALAAVLTGALGGCFILPGATPGAPSTQSTDEEDDMPTTTVRSAVAASDPRIVDVPTVMVNMSGFARVMTIAVTLSGDEPVTTDTIVDIAVAALDNAQSDIDDLTLIARAATDPSRILDLTAAAEGLPDTVEYRWINDSLQFVGADPAVIGAAR